MSPGTSGSGSPAPLREARGVEVAAIASRNPDRAAAEAQDLGIPRSYSSCQDLLADPDLDAVYIPLPNDMHLEWIKPAADAGKHILCEKPLALIASNAMEASEYAARAGVMLMEAFIYRFHPQWQLARNLVQTGEIGSVTAVQSQFCYNNTDPNNIRNRVENGSGALYAIGCYAISSARFILGSTPGFWRSQKLSLRPGLLAQPKAKPPAGRICPPPLGVLPRGYGPSHSLSRTSCPLFLPQVGASSLQILKFNPEHFCFQPERLGTEVVGLGGFEPPTSWSRTRRASPCATAR